MEKQHVFNENGYRPGLELCFGRSFGASPFFVRMGEIPLGWDTVFIFPVDGVLSTQTLSFSPSFCTVHHWPYINDMVMKHT